MTPAPSITVYLDTVSPFAYIAFHILKNDAVFQKCNITYVPIFLGGLMKACGNTAPINITNKNTWIDRERRLWAGTFTVPMSSGLPPGFPPLTLNIMRCLAVLDQFDGRADQSRLIKAFEAFYDAFWVQEKETNNPETMQSVLEAVLGSEEARRVVSAAAKEGKAGLTRNTDEAFAAGAFGLPWMVCTSSSGETESFWGVDHLGQVAAFLGLQRPNTGGWRALL